MAIHEPGRRLMHVVPLKFVQKRVAGRRRPSRRRRLSLTSMIDFLVMVVVFLLMSFSASGEIPVDKNVKLPKAENTRRHDRRAHGRGQRQPDPRRRHAAGSHARHRGGGRLQRIDELFNILKAQARALEARVQPGQGLSRASHPPGRSGSHGARREERVPDGGVRRLPERQLHGRAASEKRAPLRDASSGIVSKISDGALSGEEATTPLMTSAGGRRRLGALA